MTIKITSIEDWQTDERLIAGDSSHEGRESVDKLLAEESNAKFWNPWTKGLPFICEAENIGEAVDKMNESLFKYDYLKADPMYVDWEDADAIDPDLRAAAEVLLENVGGDEYDAMLDAFEVIFLRPEEHEEFRLDPRSFVERMLKRTA